MAGDAIRYDDSDARERLNRIYEAAGNLAPVFKNIGEHEASATKRRFIEEKAPDGAPWRDLNPLYAKTKKGPGKLRGETRQLSQIIYQVANDNVEIGSNEVYARIHNQGGVIVPKTAAALAFSMGGEHFVVRSVQIPRRQFLGFSDSSIAAIRDIIEDHFEMAAAGSGEAP